MRRRSQAHLSTQALISVVALASVAACHKDTIVTTRTVVAHVPAACPVTGDGYATYVALGDFEAGPVQPGPYFSDVGSVLPQVDTQARELVLTATENDRQWAGLAPVPAAGDVDVLLMPQARSCRLTGPVGTRTGSTFAPIGSRLALLTGGSGDPIPATYEVSLDTGAVTKASRGLQVPRTGPTVTAFGEGGLVAGGTTLALPAAPTDVAEVYSSSAGGFTSLFHLSEPRAGHAAVVLADGRSLLVGGVGADGKTPLPFMEIVDPATSSGHEENVAQLMPVLTSPVAVRLASGEVLVVGGTTMSGAPATGLQWFTADASHSSKRMQVLPAGTVTLAPLAAGGALAVVAGSSKNDTWVIDASGVVELATAPTGATLGKPRLFQGAGGAPVLWTGMGWLRWQPYAARFALLSTLDAVHPDVGDATCSADPGLAMWLDPGTQQIAGLRFDTRNAYSSLAHGAVDLASDTAPDRIAISGAIELDEGAGRLTLAAPGASVFVTDRTYADVSITMSLPTSQPPLVVLGDELGVELSVGASDLCPGLLTTKSVTSLDVERVGTMVTWAINGGTATPCRTPLADGARISIGLRAGSAEAVVRDLFVKRLGAP